MSFVRKLFALIVAAGLFLHSPAEAATYFYRYGVTPAQPTAQAPTSPAPAGTFAILIDSPVPNVAIVGDTYSATTYAYSNVGAVVFSIQSGALPAGLSINSSTGTIFGSPNAPGASSAVIQGLDTATGQIATASISIDTINAFSISGNPAAVVIANTPYSASFSLAGGTEPYGFSIGAVPTGLSFSAAASTATLAGVPTVPGSYGMAVVGTEAHGLAVQYPFLLTVADVLTISGSPPASGTVGTAYSGQLVVSGGAAPFSYALAAGTLPPGLTVKAATGIISGVPVVAGAKTGIRIKVTDASGQSVISAPFSIVISASGTQPLAISGSGTPNGVENVNYSSQFTAGGGSGGYVYALASGTLPAGLTVNPSTGLLSGVPAFGTAGTYPGISVQVTDSALHVATSNPFTLTIAAGVVPLAISGTPASSVQQGAAYAAKFTGTGGSGAGYVYAVTAGTLPPGLSLNSATGLISGVATTVGTYSGIVIRVMDSAARTASTAPFAIAVGAPPPLSIMGTAAPSVNQGANYSAIWTAFDGSGVGYHFTSVGAPLPPGLTLSDINGVQGLLSGTATVPGTYSGLQIQVMDSEGSTALSSVFSVVVVPTASPSEPLAISGSPGNGEVGTSYAAQFSASGGSVPYTYAVSSGSLPPGISLDSATGALSGNPVTGGTYGGIVVSVTDGVGTSVSTAPFQIVVTDSNPITISWAPQTNWQVDDFVAIALTVDGGEAANYVFSVNGTLPPGLSLFSNGAVFGTLTTAGTFGPFSISVTDGVRTATVTPVTFVVAEPGLFVSGFPAATATEGAAYSAQFSAAGGSGTGYVYSMNGALPSGLSLNSATGLLSGVPAAGSAGTYDNLSVHVVDDSANEADSATFSITVSPAPQPLTLAGSPAGSATEGVAYSAAFVASGGSGSGYVYSITGTLPAGLSLNASSGVLSGVPAAGSAGTYAGLIVHVADSALNTADSASFTLTVVPDGSGTPPTPSGTAASSAQVGYSYSSSPYSYSSGGGVLPYSYAIATGALPPGLSLNPQTGAITGVPTTAGVYTFAVKLVDAIGVSSAAGDTSTITVSGAAAMAWVGSNIPSISSSLGNGFLNQASLWMAMSGGVEPLTFSVSGGPPGLGIAGSNRGQFKLSGTIMEVGRGYNFTTKSYPYLQVVVTDANGATLKSAMVNATLTTPQATASTYCSLAFQNKPGMTPPMSDGVSSNCYANWSINFTSASGYVEINYSSPMLMKTKVGAIGTTSGGGTISAWYWDGVSSWVPLGSGVGSVSLAGSGLWAKSLLFKVTDGSVLSTKWGGY